MYDQAVLSILTMGETSPAEIAAEHPDLRLQDIEASFERLKQGGFITRCDAYISTRLEEYDAIMAASEVQTQKADALMTPEICNNDAMFQALHGKYHEKADELEYALDAFKRTHNSVEADAVVTAARDLHAAACKLASYLEAMFSKGEPYVH